MSDIEIELQATRQVVSFMQKQLLLLNAQVETLLVTKSYYIFLTLHSLIKTVTHMVLSEHIGPIIANIWLMLYTYELITFAMVKCTDRSL